MRKLLFPLIIFAAFLCCSCNKYDVRHTVQYFISGEGIMNISYSDAKNELISVDNVSSAWKYAFNAPADKRIIKLIVTSIDGTAVGGSILIDGVEAAEAVSPTGSVTMITQLP